MDQTQRERELEERVRVARSAEQTTREETRRPEGRRFRYSDAGDRTTIGGLFRNLSNEAALLLRQEVALAKTEVRENVARSVRNVGILASGGLVVFAGFLALLAALSEGLQVIMDRAGMAPDVYTWLAPLVVGLIVLGIGAALVTKALNTLKNEPLTPQRTKDTIRETTQWMKEKIA